MTQEKLAELCGLTVNFISRIERDKATRVSVFTVQKIAKALNVSIDTLLDDEKSKHTKQIRPNQMRLDKKLSSYDTDKAERLSDLFLKILQVK